MNDVKDEHLAEFIARELKHIKDPELARLREENRELVAALAKTEKDFQATRTSFSGFINETEACRKILEVGLQDQQKDAKEPKETLRDLCQLAILARTTHASEGKPT